MFIKEYLNSFSYCKNAVRILHYKLLPKGIKTATLSFFRKHFWLCSETKLLTIYLSNLYRIPLPLFLYFCHHQYYSFYAYLILYDPCWSFIVSNDYVCYFHFYKSYCWIFLLRTQYTLCNITFSLYIIDKYRAK